MSKPLQPPWAAGPGELLQHGINLLENDSESRRRIAMILIDNAVELTIKTYLTLPERITGLVLNRKQREDYCTNFPALLDGIEKNSPSKLIGLNLGEFEWFHRLRNELYHDGNGLTVERKHVELYAELAEVLFKSLFECELTINPPKNTQVQLIGEFFENWITIERRLAQMVPEGEKMSSARLAEKLFKSGEMSKGDYETFKMVQIIRNQLVHGEAEPEEMLRPENMTKVKRTAEVLGNMLGSLVDGLRLGLIP